MTPHELAEKIHRLTREPISGTPEEMEREGINEIEALLTEALQEAKLDAFHTGGDRHMCEEALKQSKAKAMFDNTVGDDDTDRRIKEAVAQEREECAKVAEDKQRTEALLFGPANCCSQSARTIAGRIKARLSKGTK